jgi:hypothetical protein
MKILTYFSEATQLMEPSDLEELLTQARAFNTAHGISGLLLYQSRCFLQTLEGNADVIDTLYQRIKADKRHCNLKLLFDQPLQERCFQNWSMGFHLPNDHLFKQRKGYLDVLGTDIATEIDLAEEMTFTMVSLFKQYVRNATTAI